MTSVYILFSDHELQTTSFGCQCLALHIRLYSDWCTDIAVADIESSGSDSFVSSPQSFAFVVWKTFRYI